MITNLAKAAVEGMSDMSNSGNGKRELFKEVIASIMALLVSMVIISFVGKFLWNNTVAELFTIVRPVRSAWQIIGLMLLLALFK